MEFGIEPAIAFGEMLRENEAAAQFYDGCTTEQKQAIHLQLRRIQTQEKLKAFVEHLPSAAL